MKLFFCLKYFLPGQVAGTEIYVAALAKGLIEKGYDVTVIKPGYTISDTSSYFYEGIRVLEYPESPVSDAAMQTGKRYPPGIKAFRTLLEAEQPDIIHFQEISGSNGITTEHIRVAAALGIRIFTSFHLTRYVCKRSSLLFKGSAPCDGVVKNTKCSICLLQEKGVALPIAYAAAYTGEVLRRTGADFSESKNPAGKLLQYPAYIDAHKKALHEMVMLSEQTIALNHWFGKMLQLNGLPAEKLTVIPNRIPFMTEKNVPAKEQHHAGIKLVFIGRICRIKGLKPLIDAFISIGNENTSLDIYGKVTEEDYYNECLSLANDHTGIRWKGVASPSDIVSLIAEYDLLVFPSQVEEMSPFTIAESFAAGVPVLASDLKASREQITDGRNGWLFPYRENNALGKQLKFLTDNPQLLAEARQHIPAARLFGEVVDAHLQLYGASRS
ncbi:MAG: glycosyltransferase [Ferruginibacter sp.]